MLDIAAGVSTCYWWHALIPQSLLLEIVSQDSPVYRSVSLSPLSGVSFTSHGMLSTTNISQCAMLDQLITRIYLRYLRLATDYGLLFDDSQPFIEHTDKLEGSHFHTYFKNHSQIVKNKVKENIAR